MRTPRPTIGMVNSTLAGIYTEQWLGVADSAVAAGANVISFIARAFDYPNPVDAHANAIFDLVTSERVDGIVMWAHTAGALFGGADGVGDVRARFSGIPLVSLEVVVPGATSVLFDDRAGAFAATSHLLEEHGRRRIACLHGPSVHAGARLRLAGYRDALTAHGVEVDERLVCGVETWSVAGATAAVAGMLAAGAEIDGLVAANDDLGLGAIAALEAAGLSVPGDVAVTGFDDDRLSGGQLYNGPALDERAAVLKATTATGLPLTSVRAGFYEVGARAVEILMQQLRGEATPEVVTLPVELVVRRSCGCVPAARTRTTSAPGDVAAELRALVGDREGDLLGPGWSDDLASAYELELAGNGAGAFLSLLDAAVRKAVRARVDSETIRGLLSALRRDSPVRPPEELWSSAERLVDNAIEHATRVRELLSATEVGLVRLAGHEITSAQGETELATALASTLPKLGIATCVVADYVDAERETARVVAASQGAAPLDVSTAPFAARRLVPGTELERDEPFSIIALPLRFKDSHLGYVLLERGPLSGWIYETLQEYLSENAELRRRLAELRRSEAARAVQELEVKLLETQRLESLGVLAGGIAHDFNNLLVAILGNASLAASTLPPEAPAREWLAQIEAAGQRAAELTMQMVAYAGEGRYVIEPLDLAPLLREMAAFAERAHAGLAVDVSLPGGRLGVSGDARQLRQLVLNVLTNAAEAVEQGGSVSVTARSVEIDAAGAADYAASGVVPAPGRYVELSVADDGVGMDEETALRAFEPFFTTKFTGRGLGLAAALGIVRGHRGAIRLESAPGAGTLVKVLLPADEA